MCGCPWKMSFWNHASTSGATGWPACAPLAYVATGPMTPATPARSAELEAARFDGAEAEASYEGAEGRGWKYSSLVNGCAIKREPTTVPATSRMRLPLA